MSIRVDDNWWQDLFDEVYLLTDARSVCDEGLTSREVDVLVETLRPDRAAPILDLCDLGKKKAGEERLNTVFVGGDARNTGLPRQGFQFIIVMASSFGYFIDEAENSRILSEAFRLLQPGGTLLLDLPDRDYVLRNFRSSSSHDVNEDITVVRQRELGDNIIYSRERVLSKSQGCIRDGTYCTRLYDPGSISVLLRSAGFSDVACLMDFMNRAAQGDFGCMTNRMVVTAKRVADR